MSDIQNWKKVIDGIAKEEKERSEKLSPSLLEMRYVVDYGRIIYDTLQLMNNSSRMAHEGIINFETAQRIIDLKKYQLKKDIDLLSAYLELDKA